MIENFIDKKNSSRESKVKPVFVGGSGCCGTTILGRTIGLHPNIYTFPEETKFLVSPEGSLLEWLHDPFNDALRSKFEKMMRGPYYRRPWRGREVGMFNYIPNEHYFNCLNRFLSQSPAPTLQERYEQVHVFLCELFSETLKINGASRWCDDGPLSVLYMVDLKKLFPDMKLIHIIRDGREVALSYHRLGWSKTVLEALRLWYSRVQIGRQLGRSLPDGYYMEVSFSQLIAGPIKELKKILLFIGESWHPDLENNSISNERATQHLKQSNNTLDDYFIRICGDMIEEFGWKV